MKPEAQAQPAGDPRIGFRKRRLHAEVEAPLRPPARETGNRLLPKRLPCLALAVEGKVVEEHSRSIRVDWLGYTTGDKGVNRVRLYADPHRNGTLFLEWRDRADSRKKLTIKLDTDDFTQGKEAANKWASALLRGEGPRTGELTLQSLFEKYFAEVASGRKKKTPQKAHCTTHRHGGCSSDVGEARHS